jgi:hypothetical protein
VDNDGDVDGVIAANFSGQILWVENLDGQGDFSGPQLVASWSGRPTYSRFAVGDLDADNDIDVVASDERGRIFHSRFDGERKAFSEWSSITSSFADTVQLSVADVDGDFDGDVIAVSTDHNRVAWFESLSDSAFALPVDVGRTLNRIEASRAVDLDGDGDQDFLVAISDGLQASIEWYENFDNAAGRLFVRRFIRAAQARAAIVDAGDIDSDGDVDLLAPTSDSLIWLVNNGSQEFGSPIALSGSRNTYETRVVDFDGDGDLDVVGISTESISWYENVDGQGAFERHEVLSDVRDVHPHTIDDYDADGDIDIIVRTTCSGACAQDYRVLRNNEGQFEARTIFRQSRAGSDLSTGVFGDLDGDRDLDLVFHTRFGPLTVYTSGREGSLREHQEIVSTTPLTPDLVDIDADGDLDIVGYHSDRISSVWYENLANNAEFSDGQPLIEFESTRRDVVFADWDSDGDVDLMTYTRSPSNIRWLENRPVGDVNGDGVFDSSDLVAVLQQGKYDDGVPRNASFEEGDWNGDGEFDASDLTLAFQSGGYQ